MTKLSSEEGSFNRLAIQVLENYVGARLGSDSMQVDLECASAIP